MTSLEPLLLLPSAFLAGVLMFLAPCTLPIVPGYLLFIAGVPEGGALKKRKSVLLNAVAFVSGFSLVFIVLGLFAGSVGVLLGPYRGLLAHLSGVVLVVFGFMLLGVFSTVFAREWHLKLPSFLTIGVWQSSLLIGVLFAFGWSPCVGPILGTILLVASQSATALQGGLLLAVFSLGLGVPFILTALMMEKITSYINRWGRYTVSISRMLGILLILVGLLLLLGYMAEAVAWGCRFFDWFGYDRLYNYL